MRNLFAAVILIFAATALATGQESKKNEIAVTVGRMLISDQGVTNTNFFDNTVHSGKGLSFEGDYARKLQSYRWGTLSVEVPVVVNPDEDLNYGLNQVPKDYS